MKEFLNKNHITKIEIFEKEIMHDLHFIPYREKKYFGFFISKSEAHWENYWGEPIDFPFDYGYIENNGDEKTPYNWPLIKIELSSKTTLKYTFKTIPDLYTWLDNKIPEWKEYIEIKKL
jgi:hypothetical protein